MHSFSAKDGSRAFITGHFDEKGLREDVTGLTNSQILDLLGWMEFYEKEYTYIGVYIMDVIKHSLGYWYRGQVIGDYHLPHIWFT